MQDFLNKKIVVGITGGVAAYKSAQLVRDLVKLGAQVRVVMTDSALSFMTPTTMQALSGQEVRCSLFDSDAERAMGHIELARWADYLLIAPISADFIAKMAHGLANDLLSTLYLVTDIPVMICPGMNHSMWNHPATQDNIIRLQQRGVIVVGPTEGAQACGEYGLGRMSEPHEIIDALRLCDVHQILKGHHVLITAGPTQEPIDPVRYLSNRSSGKMGYALASAAVMAGAEVTLISGPTKLSVPSGVHFVSVQTAKQMSDAVLHHLKQGMLVIACAAVADYSPKAPSEQKIKKNQHNELTVVLKKNPDILSQIVCSRRADFVVGFAAETEHVEKNARMKREKKSVDMIVANQVGAQKGFDQDDNEVLVITPTQTRVLDRMHKTRLAACLITEISKEIQKK